MFSQPPKSDVNNHSTFWKITGLVITCHIHFLIINYKETNKNIRGRHTAPEPQFFYLSDINFSKINFTWTEYIYMWLNDKGPIHTNVNCIKSLKFLACHALRVELPLVSPPLLWTSPGAAPNSRRYKQRLSYLSDVSFSAPR